MLMCNVALFYVLLQAYVYASTSVFTRKKDLGSLHILNWICG